MQMAISTLSLSRANGNAADGLEYSQVTRVCLHVHESTDARCGGGVDGSASPPLRFSTTEA